MKILVLPGDGIGPEITDATLNVLDRANATVTNTDISSTVTQGIGVRIPELEMAANCP